MTLVTGILKEEAGLKYEGVGLKGKCLCLGSLDRVPIQRESLFFRRL